MTIQIDWNDLMIVLWKAKLFGVHTEMYSVADLERCRGQRVTLRWSAD